MNTLSVHMQDVGLIQCVDTRAGRANVALPDAGTFASLAKTLGNIDGLITRKASSPCFAKLQGFGGKHG